MTPRDRPAGLDWRIANVRLVVELGDPVVVVTSELDIRRRAGSTATDIELDGNSLVLRSLSVDGAPRNGGFEAHSRGLRIELGGADNYVVTTVVEAAVGGPNAEGFTTRPGLVSTTCEPEGFRRITYFLDTPANRSWFDVTVVGDPVHHPVMLSNGNRVDVGRFPDGRHWARFVDPVDKPSYLFALIAGRLTFVERIHRTRSGREIRLSVAARPEAAGGAGFALDILDRVMTFDEVQSGVEHDLDHLIFAAIPGYPDATEYHGLMFFDEQLLIADENGHTDDDLLLIIANVAHEYGHHLRGNRITVASWGQLALKEGLTVLFQNDTRHHLFGEAARVMDLLDLRRVQYPEEFTIGAPVLQGEVADPHQLYTRTTYLKGAEIFRMMRTVVGSSVWREVMDEYVRRHDLQSVTVDDFVRVVSEVAPAHVESIAGIARWFTYRGRPRLTLDGGSAPRFVRLDSATEEPPLHIPLRTAEVSTAGVDGDRVRMMTGRELVVDPPSHGSVLSPIRDFSALVDFESREPVGDLVRLLACEDDPFSRWRAGEELMIRVIDRHRIGDHGGAEETLHALVDTLRVIMSADIDHGLLAQLLMPPDEFMLGDREEMIDVEGVSSGLAYLRGRIGIELGPELLDLLRRTDLPDGSDRSTEAIKRRMLLEPALGYLLATDSNEALGFALDQFASDNHTRSLRALTQLAHVDRLPVDDYFAEARLRWADSPRLIDRWMRAQSGSRRRDTHLRVRRMLESPDYLRTDRSRVMGVWFPYCTRNRAVFHDPSGEGYRLFVDEVAVLMGINPGLVLRLVGDLLQFKRFEPHRRGLIRDELQRLTEVEGFPDFAVSILKGLLATP